MNVVVFAGVVFIELMFVLSIQNLCEIIFNKNSQNK